MGDLFTALDWVSGLLAAGALAVITLTHKELKAARIALVGAAALAIGRWVMWSFLTDANWPTRAGIGAVMGALILAGLPALWKLSIERQHSPAEPSPVSTPAATPRQTMLDFSAYSQKQCFDYSTNDGLARVTRSQSSHFELRFGKGSNTNIYLYKDNTNISAIARIRNVAAGQSIDFSDFDSSSRVYTLNLGEQFIVKNSQGEFLQGKILSLKDDSRGDPNDEVCFAYEFDISKTGKFTAL